MWREVSEDEGKRRRQVTVVVLCGGTDEDEGEGALSSSLLRRGGNEATGDGDSDSARIPFVFGWQLEGTTRGRGAIVGGSVDEYPVGVSIKIVK